MFVEAITMFVSGEAMNGKLLLSQTKGLFEPKVMFFGLTNLPATFQLLINSIFTNLIAQGKAAVYLDNILIWSSTIKEHCKIVHKVLHRL
jgi:hypothetical protein